MPVELEPIFFLQKKKALKGDSGLMGMACYSLWAGNNMPVQMRSVCRELDQAWGHW